MPHSVLAGYSGTPLAKKLGIKANSTVALAGEPPGFRKVLGDLPEGAELREHTGAGDRERALRVAGEPGGLPAKPAGTDLTIWFARSREELWSGIKQMARVAGGQKLWIAWPKKASSIATDLTQQDVREAGLGAGLVDYKICAIDASWSGLLFTRRKPAAAGGR